LYENAEAPLAPEVERADLLPLLAEGNLRFGFGRSSCEIAKSQVFLDSERLLQLAQCALESHVTARPTYRRISLSRASIALRRGSGDAAVELQILGQGNGARAQLTCELPALSFARSVARFAIQIAERFRTADPSQQYNLRLRSLVSAAAALLEALRLDPRDESRVNPSPEVYKRFVPRLRRARGYWENGAKIRFSPHWEAIVPSIDLRGTFLCGERLLIGSANETACLDRRSGEVLWKQPTRPASCVVSPAGLLRVEPSGRVQSLHLEDGSVRFTTRVAPRVGGGAVGSVLYGGGLPKLLVLAEGDRQISALDLLTGEPRWRYSARRAISPKLRRSGRLIIVAGGDSQMLALDASTGQVVWCLKSRLPFTGDLAQDAEGAFAICGASGGVFQLVRFDPWTGEFAWSMDLDARPIPGRAPLLTPTEVIVPVLDESGVGAVAYDRATGGKLWEHEPGLATQGSAWLVVDDLVLVNSGAGTLLALSARTGAPRYNHVFTRSSDEDQPRSLDLVLRDGALFVPQAQVTVLRPTDGEILGQVESDLVPDLIRVDERCDVFIAEESGYVAAFSAAPRLTLLG
jgi:outer membrane protein assembly factor BamB